MGKSRGIIPNASRRGNLPAMSLLDERRCRCGNADENAYLERCVVCGKWFCADCAYRTMGRRFCSQHCSVQYYYGETDDDENDLTTAD